MVLLRQDVIREGKRYTNFYYCWRYKESVYKLRVRPVFDKDYDKLGAIAKKVEPGEELDKYVD